MTDNYFYCYRFTNYLSSNGNPTTIFDIEKNIGNSIFVPYFLSTFYTMERTVIDWLLDIDKLFLIILVDRRFKNFVCLAKCGNNCYYGDENELLFGTDTYLTILSTQKIIMETQKIILY